MNTKMKREIKMMKNPKFPKRETEILHDKAYFKSPRIEDDHPNSNHKSIVTCDCHSKDDNKPSETEVATGEAIADEGKISRLRDFDERFSDTDDESDNEISSFSDTDDESDNESSSYENDKEFDRIALEGMEALDVKPLVVLKESDVPNYVLYCLRTDMKGGDYEYVKHVSTIPAVLEGWFGVHTNFFARLKGTDSAPELFFAALRNGCPMKVEECCILNPRPFSIGETNPNKDTVVYHCEHVQCDYCNEPFDIDHLDIDSEENSFICV